MKNPDARDHRRRLACLVLATWTLGVCAKEVPLPLPPAPRAVTSGQLDLFADAPDSIKNNRVSIFYATPRLPDNDGSSYGKAFDDNLRVGKAMLTIGTDDLDWETLHSAAHTADRGTPVTAAQKHLLDIHLKQVDQLGQLAPADSLTQLSPELQTFVDQINDSLAQSYSKDITIIVHGAFNSFYYAAAEAAQYRFYTGKQATIVAYVWPAVESNLTYGSNVRNAEKSKAGLGRLLKLLGEHSNAERINIIGYSVGGRLASGAIAELADEYTERDLVALGNEWHLGHLYLTASDGSIEEFRHYAPRFVELFDEVSITIAYDDPILGRAQLTGGGDRLGRPTKPSAVKAENAPTEAQRQGIRTAVRNDQLYILNLEMSDIRGYEFSHGAWYLNPWVSSDVFVSLHLGLHPSERGLASDEVDGLRFWHFPENYVATLQQALLLYQAREQREAAKQPASP